MEESGSLQGLRGLAANGGGSPKKGHNSKSKLQGEWGKRVCMFHFHSLPYKAAKGQSQRQHRELVRTSRQIATLAYRGGEHSLSYPEPSCGPAPPIPAHTVTLSCPCSQRLWQARTLPAWQEPQLSTSKESPLKYHFAISNPPRTLDPCH